MAGSLTLPTSPAVLTGDDIIRAGACREGVGRRLQALARSGSVAAAESPDRLLTLVPKEERQYIAQALASFNPASDCSSGCYGYGYGDGYGDGDGDGDGYGYGYGDGDGDGDGDPYGEGRSYG